MASRKDTMSAFPLTKTGFFQTVHRLFRGRIPGQLVIQLTDRCNATCPQCGMRVTEKFSRSTLSMDEVKRMLDAAARQNIQAVSFTGGEPLLYPEMLCELIRHAAMVGIPYIRTGTNGYMFRNAGTEKGRRQLERFADRLAETPLRNFWISIDSSQPKIHEKMRGFTGVIDGIRRAIPVFHQRGVFPSANLGINRNVGGHMTSTLTPDSHSSAQDYLAAFHRRFSEAFHGFFHFIIDMGFTIVNTCYPMSIGAAETANGLTPVYAATATDNLVRFTRAEKAVLYRALTDTVTAFRSKIRIFTPQCALHALIHQHAGRASNPYPCRGGIDFFFVEAADAVTYPCGFRGEEPFGKFWEMRNGKPPSSQCVRCDWECFRDPSELFGPLLQLTAAPFSLFRKLKEDPAFFRLWQRDLRYYAACDFFNGRKQPDAKRLAAFTPTNAHASGVDGMAGEISFGNHHAALSRHRGIL